MGLRGQSLSEPAFSAAQVLPNDSRQQPQQVGGCTVPYKPQVLETVDMSTTPSRCVCQGVLVTNIGDM